MASIHHYGVMCSIFITLEILCALPVYPHATHTTLVTTDLLLSSVLSFPKCHVVEIMQYVAF